MSICYIQDEDMQYRFLRAIIEDCMQDKGIAFGFLVWFGFILFGLDFLFSVLKKCNPIEIKINFV